MTRTQSVTSSGDSPSGEKCRSFQPFMRMGEVEALAPATSISCQRNRHLCVRVSSLEAPDRGLNAQRILGRTGRSVWGRCARW